MIFNTLVMLATSPWIAYAGARSVSLSDRPGAPAPQAVAGLAR